jgi:hypothetical protein
VGTRRRRGWRTETRKTRKTRRRRQTPGGGPHLCTLVLGTWFEWVCDVGECRGRVTELVGG